MTGKRSNRRKRRKLNRERIWVVNWKEARKKRLSPVMHQGDYAICWALSLIRQLAALCRENDLLDTETELSIQHLLELVGPANMWEGYGIDDIWLVGPLLSVDGVVEEQYCPLSYNEQKHFLEDKDKYATDEVEVHWIGAYLERGQTEEQFEETMLHHLSHRPITVAVKVNERPDSPPSDGKGLFRYVPDQDSSPTLHYMLATGHGFDENNTAFLRCQDSYGPDWGHEGFVDCALGEELVTHFFVFNGARKMLAAD